MEDRGRIDGGREVGARSESACCLTDWFAAVTVMRPAVIGQTSCHGHSAGTRSRMELAPQY